MAIDMYMKCTPRKGSSDTIRGDSEDAAHEGWTEIDGFTLKVRSEVVEKSNKVQFDSIQIDKRMDLSSPELLKSCKGTSAMAEMVIEACRAGEEDDSSNPIPFFKLTLADCHIDNIEFTHGTGDDPLPHEKLTVSFKTINAKFTGSSIKANTPGATASFFFNVPSSDETQ